MNTTSFEGELLDKVYSAPYEDAPRLVYADWLLENESPRGEFIVLQYKRASHGLTVDEQKRESKLIEVHARTWLGPLAPLVDQHDMVFCRGFLAACTAWVPKGSEAGLLDAPAWSTVERIGGDLDLIAHRASKGLRSAGPLSSSELALLLNRKTVLSSIVELRVEGALGASDVDKQLGSTVLFPSLKRLAFVYPDQHHPGSELLNTLYPERYEAFFNSPIGAQLDGFAVRHPHMLSALHGAMPALSPMLSGWLRLLRKASWLSKLNVVPTRGLAFRFLQSPAGIALTVEWHSNYASADPRSIAEALSDPEIRLLTSVRIEQHGVHLPHHQKLMEQILAPVRNAKFRHRAQSGPDLRRFDPAEEPTNH